MRYLIGMFHFIIFSHFLHSTIWIAGPDGQIFRYFVEFRDELLVARPWSTCLRLWSMCLRLWSKCRKPWYGKGSPGLQSRRSSSGRPRKQSPRSRMSLSSNIQWCGLAGRWSRFICSALSRLKLKLLDLAKPFWRVQDEYLPMQILALSRFAFAAAD